MKVKITVEASSDSQPDFCEKYGVEVIPLPVYLGGKEFWDPIDVTVDDVFNYVDTSKQLPKTAANPAHNFEQNFRRILETNEKILHISFTTHGSCNCQNAGIAAAEIGKGKVTVFNTLQMSAGIQIMVIHARKLLDEGKSIEEVVVALEKLRSKIKLQFMVEKLDYLRKGGRCSALQRFGANLLKIRPSIVLIDGKLTTGKKYKGRFDMAVNEYISDALAQNPNIDKNFIYYGGTRMDKEIIESARKRFEAAGFKQAVYFEVGITISCHCGPGTFGMAFTVK